MPLVQLPLQWECQHSAVPAGPLTGSLCFSSLALLPSSLEDSLLGEGPVERPGARLCLSAGPLRTAVRRRYGRRLGLERTAHVLLAGDCSPTQHGQENGAWTWRSGPYTGHWVDNYGGRRPWRCYRDKPFSMSVLAAHLWKTCDPDASGTFRSCPPEALKDLPFHLVGPRTS